MRDITRNYALRLVREKRATFGSTFVRSDGGVRIAVIENPMFGNLVWSCPETKAKTKRIER